MKMRAKRKKFMNGQTRVKYYLPDGGYISWRRSDRNGGKKLVALLLGLV